MIHPDVLTQTLQAHIPDAHVQVFDKTGMADHYIVLVKAQSFTGKNPMDRHRTVMACLKPLMETGELHAVEIQTGIPEN